MDSKENEDNVRMDSVVENVSKESRSNSGFNEKTQLFNSFRKGEEIELIRVEYVPFRTKLTCEFDANSTLVVGAELLSHKL